METTGNMNVMRDDEIVGRGIPAGYGCRHLRFFLLIHTFSSFDSEDDDGRKTVC